MRFSTNDVELCRKFEKVKYPFNNVRLTLSLLVCSDEVMNMLDNFKGTVFNDPSFCLSGNELQHGFNGVKFI